MASSLLARSRSIARAAGRWPYHPAARSLAVPLSSAAGRAETAHQPKPSPTRSIKLPAAFALAGASLLGGYCIGTYHSEELEEMNKNRELPKGERGCCSCEDSGTTKEGAPKLTEAQSALSSKLQRIVGKEHVYDGMKETSKNAHFLKGARLGQGTALCIVQPGTVREAVKCLQEAVDAGCVVLPQGSNTGLTGGSVPRNETPDTRPAVIISMKRLDAHFPIDDGKKVVCLAGCGISALASSIQSWFPDRESHSILGSTFLNPTTAAGVAFGSGGVYVRKGPARTDRALYCKVSRNKWGENIVSVVNSLGIKGMEDSDFVEHSGQDAVGALDAYANDVRQGFRRNMAQSSDSVHGKAKASDSNYHNTVCECTNDVSRYNADTAGEDCNRSEGKVLILATVHDTFPVPEKKRVFWVSFPDMETTLAFRREVCLNNPKDLPISCEYMDRDSVDIIDRSGRIGTYMIRYLGTGDLMGFLWGVKLSIEGLPFSWAPTICDKLLHALNSFVPECIPGKFMKAGREWDHHCIVAVGEFGDGTLDRFMERMGAFVEKYNQKAVADESAVGSKIVSVVEAESPTEVTALNAFRFVAALAFKMYCVGENIQGISVDYALPKNGGLAPEMDPSAVTPLKRMRYSHFGCNVVHEDIAYALGVDTHKEKMAFKQIVEDDGGKLPAEHGHGTEYNAPPNTQKRWMKMDPLNVMNPGVGGLSTLPKYGKK
ncbi:hypothetical protein ACHAXT_006277 [Thalassiosira profunda]